MDIFKKASRLNLTFNTEKGVLNTNQLWTLEFSKLENYEIALKKEVEAVATTEVRRRGTNVVNQDHLTNALRLSIVSDILDTRYTEDEARVKARETSAKKAEELAVLDTLIRDKEQAKLKDLSIEELQKLRDERMK